MSLLCKIKPWYPPAETKIPWRAIFSAFSGNAPDFEKELCSYLDVKYCILGESARALLFRLIQQLKKIHANRNQVLIPAYTCYSVAAAIVKAGLKIAVYDLDPETLQPDVNTLKGAMCENTMAVVYQHLFGLPVPGIELQRSAREKGAYLIEDAAQFLEGPECDATGVDSADFRLLSFGRGKPLPIGSGGALLSHTHAEVLGKIKLKSETGILKHTFMSASLQIVSNPALYWIPESLPLGLGQTVFDPGFKVRGIPQCVIKIGAHALSAVDQINAHRRKIAAAYTKNLRPDYLILPLSNESPSYTRFPVMAATGALPIEIKRLGVRRMYPNAVHREPRIAAHIVNPVPRLTGAETIAKKMITLPTHLSITIRLAEEIATKINEWVDLKGKPCIFE